MTGSEHRPREYGEKEVARLLERATELQRDEGSPAPVAGGLTLPELEEIAAEAGIDPRYLRRAAVELAQGGGSPKSRWSWLTGAPVTLRLERTVPGELGTEAFEGLSALIQQNADTIGHASLVGHTLTWQGETPNRTRWVRIVVSSRAGETHIRIEERLNQLAGALFGGLIGGVGGGAGGAGMGIALGVFGSGVLAAALPVGAVAGSYLAARTIFARTAGRRRETLENILQQLSAAVSETAGAAAGARLPDDAKAPERLPP